MLWLGLLVVLVAAAALSFGAGRPRIAAEQGLTDHQARRLVHEIRRSPARPHGERHVTARRGQQEDHTDDVTTPYPSADDAAVPDPPRPTNRGGSGGGRERQARAHPQAAREG